MRCMIAEDLGCVKRTTERAISIKWYLAYPLEARALPVERTKGTNFFIKARAVNSSTSDSNGETRSLSSSSWLLAHKCLRSDIKFTQVMYSSNFNPVAPVNRRLRRHAKAISAYFAWCSTTRPLEASLNRRRSAAENWPDETRKTSSLFREVSSINDRSNNFCCVASEKSRHRRGGTIIWCRGRYSLRLSMHTDVRCLNRVVEFFPRFCGREIYSYSWIQLSYSQEWWGETQTSGMTKRVNNKTMWWAEQIMPTLSSEPRVSAHKVSLPIIVGFYLQRSYEHPNQPAWYSPVSIPIFDSWCSDW